MSSYQINFNNQALTIDSWPDNIKDLLDLRQQLHLNRIDYKKLITELNLNKNKYNRWQYWIIALLISAPYLAKRHYRYSDLRYINYHLTDYLTYLALNRPKPKMFEINMISSLTNYFIDHELKHVASPLIHVTPHEQKPSWLLKINNKYTNSVKSWPLSLHSTYLRYHFSQNYLKDRIYHVKKIKTYSNARSRSYYKYETYYDKSDQFLKTYHQTATSYKSNNPYSEFWKAYNREQNYYIVSTLQLMAPPDLNDYIDNHYSNLPDINLDDFEMTKDLIKATHETLNDPDLADPRNICILKRRFGFNDTNNPQTLKEIGDSLNVTRERIRQVVKQTLGHLTKFRYLHRLFPEHSFKDIVRYANSIAPGMPYVVHNIPQFFDMTPPSFNPARHDYLFYLKGDCLTDPDYDYLGRHDIIKLILRNN